MTETASGVAGRPVLDSLVETLGPGDTLAVTEVSRLGRTTAKVLLLADSLIVRGVHLSVLNLGIDTATPAIIVRTRPPDSPVRAGTATRAAESRDRRGPRTR